MGKRRRSATFFRRLGLLAALLLTAAVVPPSAAPAPVNAFQPTAFPHVSARRLPAAAQPELGAGQIYVKPGGRPVTRSAAPPIHLTPVPLPGGGEMVVIPPSLYPAARAEIGPDGQLRIVCHEDGDHATHVHGQEAVQ